MDFDLDEAQRVIAESAAAVLGGAAGGDAPGSEAGLAGGPGWPGAAAWRALAKAGLLATVLPSWLGGDDLGVLEAAVLLTEAGRAAAAVPALATLMLGVLPVVRHGDRELAERVLAGVGAGEVLLTAGVREQGAPMPAAPATVATLTGSGAAGTVTGTKVGVPYAEQARWILVPATLTGGGRAVVVIDRTGAGVTTTRTPVSGSAPEYTVRLEGAPVIGVLRAGLGDTGAARPGAADDAVADLYRLAAAGAAAMADGAVAGALALTSGYIARREQFGRPLATFQAVAGEIADVYIVSRTLHLAALSACWRLATGRDAAQDADVAAYWLAREAPPALRICHQLHGGIGVDISYPLHRYSGLITDLARFTGGAQYRLDLLQEAPCSSS